MPEFEFAVRRTFGGSLVLYVRGEELFRIPAEEADKPRTKLEMLTNFQQRLTEVKEKGAITDYEMGQILALFLRGM